MKTNFFDKLKEDTVIVIDREDGCHVAELLEDYNEDNLTTKVFVRYKCASPCAETTRLFNYKTRNEQNRKYIYLVIEEYWDGQISVWR